MKNPFGHRPWRPYLGKIPSTCPALTPFGSAMMLVLCQSDHRHRGLEETVTYHSGRLAAYLICEDMPLHVDVDADINWSLNGTSNDCLQVKVCTCTEIYLWLDELRSDDLRGRELRQYAPRTVCSFPGA